MGQQNVGHGRLLFVSHFHYHHNYSDKGPPDLNKVVLKCIYGHFIIILLDSLEMTGNEGRERETGNNMQQKNHIVFLT